MERTWIHVKFLCSRQHYFNFSQRWPLVCQMAGQKDQGRGRGKGTWRGENGEFWEETGNLEMNFMVQLWDSFFNI